jgi:ribosomal protein S18 acetylase RimI-like enzyme
MLDDLPWHALRTEHARFAIAAPAARKYPADMAPFGGTADQSADSLNQLLELLTPGETIYLMGSDPPHAPGLITNESSFVLQMVAAEVFDQRFSPLQGEAAPVLLSAEDASAMGELTTLVYPAFFRPRTYEMGRYYGVRLNGELVAMAGERMAVPLYREISGVCTHPAHTGKGYAAALVQHLVREHARARVRSFLHVSPENTRAIALYSRLGFLIRKEIPLHSVTRQISGREDR